MSRITDGYEIIFMDCADVLPRMGAEGPGCYAPSLLLNRDAYFGLLTGGSRLSPRLASHDILLDLTRAQGETPPPMTASKFLKFRLRVPESLVEIRLDGQVVGTFTPPSGADGTGWQAGMTHPAFASGSPAPADPLEIPMLFNTFYVSDALSHVISASSDGISRSASFTVENGPRVVCPSCGRDHRAWQLGQIADWWSRVRAMPQAGSATSNGPPAPAGIFGFQTQAPELPQCDEFAQLQDRFGTVATFYELSGQHLGSLTVNPGFTLLPGIDPHDVGSIMRPLSSVGDVYGKFAAWGWAGDPHNWRGTILVNPKVGELPKTIVVSRPFFASPLTSEAKLFGALLFVDIALDWACVFFPSVRNSLFGLPCGRDEPPTAIVYEGTSGFGRLDIGGVERFLLWTTGYAGSPSVDGGTGRVRNLGRAEDQSEIIGMEAKCETGNDSRWCRGKTTFTLQPVGEDGEPMNFQAIGMTFSASLWRQHRGEVTSCAGQVLASVRTPQNEWRTVPLLNVNFDETSGEFVPERAFDPFEAAPDLTGDAAMAWSGIFRIAARDLHLAHFTGFRLECFCGVAGTRPGLKVGMFLQAKPIYYHDLTGDLGVAGATVHPLHPFEIGPKETIRFSASMAPGVSYASVKSKVTLKKLHCTTTEDDTGSDEVKLVIYADDKTLETLTRSMNDGDDWALDRTFEVERWFQVNLWDEDLGVFFDEDDFLGFYNSNDPQAGTFSQNLQKGGADYTLTFSVQDFANLTPIERLVSYQGGDGSQKYPVRLRYNYSWDFGDGVTQETASPNVSHTYGAAGTYDVVVRCRSALIPGDSVHSLDYWKAPAALYGGIGDERRFQVLVAPYIGNPNTGEIHLPSCTAWKVEDRENQILWNTLAEARQTVWRKQRKYDNCAYCLGASTR